LVALVALVASAGPAAAQGTLQSAASGPWTDPATWQLTAGSDADGVPDADDSVTVLAGHTVTMDGNPGAALALTVAGTLDFAGALTTTVGLGGLAFQAGGNLTGSAAGVLVSQNGLALAGTLTSDTVLVRLTTAINQAITGTGSIAKLDLAVNVVNNGDLTVRSTVTGSTVTITAGAGSTLELRNPMTGVTLSASGAVNKLKLTGGNMGIPSGNVWNLDLTGTPSKSYSTSITMRNVVIGGADRLALGSSKNCFIYGSVTITTSDPTAIQNQANNNIFFFRAPTPAAPTALTGTFAGTLQMARLTYDNTSGVAVDLNVNSVITFTINPGVTVTPAAGIRFTGTATFTVNGTLKVTRDAAPADGFLTQFPLSGTRTLTGGTIDYASAAMQTISPVNYGSLTSSGNGPRILASSGTIGIAGTFAPGAGVYTTAGSTVNFNGASTQTIPAFTFDNLTIGGAKSATNLAGDVTVDGTLTISASTVATGASAFHVVRDDAGAVAIGGGSINGGIVRPVAASSSAAYTLTDPQTQIVPDGAQGARTVSARSYQATAPPDPGTAQLVDRYYDITPDGTLTATLRLAYAEAELNGLPEASLGLLRYDGGAWVAVPSRVDAAANYVEAVAVATWGSFAIGAVDRAAPADVAKVGARSGDAVAALDWSPAAALASPDFTGVIVLRRSGAAVADAPTTGTAYGAGQSIGASTVAFVGTPSDVAWADGGVTNGEVVHYRLFAFDTLYNYAGGVATHALPRPTASFKWAYTTSAASLAPAGIAFDATTGSASTGIVASGNDRLLQRLSEADGARGAWDPPVVGGAVQGRPAVGDLGPDGSGNAVPVAYLGAQNGYLYRYGLAAAGSPQGAADAAGAAGCSGGVIQASPAVVLDAYDGNGIAGDDAVVVGTRCGASDNKVVLYALDLATLHDAYDGDADGTGAADAPGLGVSNGTPFILYRDDGANLVYVPVRQDGGDGESLVVLEVGAGPAFVRPAYSEIRGAGDVDTAPVVFRLARPDHAPRLVFGTTAGTVFLHDALARTGPAPAPLAALDSRVDGTDGPVKGIAVSTPEPLGGGAFGHWVVWTTDSRVHGMRVTTATGLFDAATYWSAAVTAPSLPLVLRKVGGTENTHVYVGAGDGHLYGFNMDGSLANDWLVEAGTTVGDPTFDYNDGSAQGLVVGTTAGVVHWIRLP
jgi:hypothetical protein